MENTESCAKFNTLLPFCVESLCDVFLNVLKASIAQSKLDDFVNALKFGLSGEHFSIEPEDFSTNWKQLNSTEQQVRQSKILGLWAIEHFLALGKKFNGASWKPPKRKSFYVVGQSQINTDQMDTVVFEKLKLRLFELNDLSPTTLKKLKHLFINVPANIGKSNEVIFSTRMKSFEIDDDWVEECWKALKVGTFSMDSSLEQRIDLGTVLTQPSSVSHREAVSSRTSMTRKRAHQDNPTDIVDHSIRSDSVSGRKRPSRDNTSSADASDGTHSELSDFQSPTESDNESESHENVTRVESSIDSVQVILLDMRKEVWQLTDLVRSTNQKDDEIVRLKASSQELMQAKENLINEHQILKEESEKQTAFITALQKGVDAISKMQMQSESELSASLEVVEKMKLEIAELEGQIRNLSESKAAELNTAMKTNEKLQDNLNVLKNDSTTLLAELKLYIESLEERVTTADELNSETLDQNKHLQEKIVAMEDCVRAKDTELVAVRLRLSEKKCLNVETQTDGYTFRDVELQVDLYSENRKEVEVQTNTCPTRDVESQADLSSESRREIETQTDTYAEITTEFEGDRGVNDEDNHIRPNDKQAESKFETDDPIVQQCRDELKKLDFGWIKFYPNNTSTFCPGFVYSAESDGIRKAKKVTGNGYISNTKYRFFDFTECLPDAQKGKAESAALKKCNKKFNFSFV